MARGARGGRQVLIHILVTREDGEWLAHALEFDLMAASATDEDAVREICDMIDAYFEACADRGLSLSEARRPAPGEFFKRYQDVFFDEDSEAVFIRRSFHYPAPRRGAKPVALV